MRLFFKDFESKWEVLKIKNDYSHKIKHFQDTECSTDANVIMIFGKDRDIERYAFDIEKLQIIWCPDKSFQIPMDEVKEVVIDQCFNDTAESDDRPEEEEKEEA